ncbi:MAG TPA: RNA polymerase sigma factor [Vicinamibacterales bacterium]|nr:RNA polymerase sigma factor [Vicinamibacterales bacterium]
MSQDPPSGDPVATAPPASLDPESTQHLLARAQRGEREALDRLMARHAAPLQRWARGRLPRWARDLADTEDLVQDTLLQTFKRIGDFEARGVGALQAYLRQAIQNRIRDELRRKGRRPESAPLDAALPDPGVSPLEEAIGAEAVDRYERALAALRVEDREAIIGRVEMGYSYAALAEALGKPTSEAARKAAERALVRLAEEMSRAAESGDP